MLSLWLSHDKYLINLVHKIGFLQFSLPDKVIYDYYFDTIPKGRRYIKWTKKTPEEKQKLKDISELQKKYKYNECNLNYLNKTETFKNSCTKQISILLNLNKTYSESSSKYSKNLIRNLTKANKNGLNFISFSTLVNSAFNFNLKIPLYS